MQVYAEQAKNHSLVQNAITLRLRAERRIGELLREMKKRGERDSGKGNRNPTLKSQAATPKLSDLGVTRVQSSRWQRLADIDAADFEALVTDARDKVSRAVRNAVREVEIEQEREVYRTRIKEGGTVADLEALAANGFRAGALAVDFPWPFETYSGKGKQRSAERRYDCWSLERILAFAPLIGRLAAADAALFLWGVCPELPGVLDVIKACGGFEYDTIGFFWLKTTPGAEVITLDGKGLHWGMGYSTRSNIEPVLLAKRAAPRRLSMDVHQVVIAPVGAHSEKPAEVYRRIERLYPGPYLELFARKPRANWFCWGDEVRAQRGQS
jgi:N6-adenosine-specific RNA methylase IME4